MCGIFGVVNYQLNEVKTTCAIWNSQEQSLYLTRDVQE